MWFFSPLLLSPVVALRSSRARLTAPLQMLSRRRRGNLTEENRFEIQQRLDTFRAVTRCCSLIGRLRAILDYRSLARVPSLLRSSRGFETKVEIKTEKKPSIHFSSFDNSAISWPRPRESIETATWYNDTCAQYDSHEYLKKTFDQSISTNILANLPSKISLRKEEERGERDRESSRCVQVSGTLNLNLNREAWLLSLSLSRFLGWSGSGVPSPRAFESRLGLDSALTDPGLPVNLRQIARMTSKRVARTRHSAILETGQLPFRFLLPSPSQHPSSPHRPWPVFRWPQPARTSYFVDSRGHPFFKKKERKKSRVCRSIIFYGVR